MQSQGGAVTHACNASHLQADNAHACNARAQYNSLQECRTLGWHVHGMRLTHLCFLSPAAVSLHV